MSTCACQGPRGFRGLKGEKGDTGPRGYQGYSGVVDVAGRPLSYNPDSAIITISAIQEGDLTAQLAGKIPATWPSSSPLVYTPGTGGNGGTVTLNPVTMGALDATTVQNVINGKLAYTDLIPRAMTSTVSNARSIASNGPLRVCRLSIPSGSTSVYTMCLTPNGGTAVSDTRANNMRNNYSANYTNASLYSNVNSQLVYLVDSGVVSGTYVWIPGTDAFYWVEDLYLYDGTPGVGATVGTRMFVGYILRKALTWTSALSRVAYYQPQGMSSTNGNIDYYFRNDTIWVQIGTEYLPFRYTNTDHMLEGNNLFYLTSRTRADVSAGTGLSYNSSTGVFTASQSYIQTTVDGKIAVGNSTQLSGTPTMTKSGTGSTAITLKVSDAYVNSMISAWFTTNAGAGTGLTTSTTFNCYDMDLSFVSYLYENFNDQTNTAIWTSKTILNGLSQLWDKFMRVRIPVRFDQGWASHLSVDGDHDNWWVYQHTPGALAHLSEMIYNQGTALNSVRLLLGDMSQDWTTFFTSMSNILNQHSGNLYVHDNTLNAFQNLLVNLNRDLVRIVDSLAYLWGDGLDYDVVYNSSDARTAARLTTIANLRSRVAVLEGIGSRVVTRPNTNGYNSIEITDAGIRVKLGDSNTDATYISATPGGLKFNLSYPPWTGLNCSSIGPLPFKLWDYGSSSYIDNAGNYGSSIYVAVNANKGLRHTTNGLEVSLDATGCLTHSLIYNGYSNYQGGLYVSRNENEFDITVNTVKLRFDSSGGVQSGSGGVKLKLDSNGGLVTGSTGAYIQRNDQQFSMLSNVLHLHNNIFAGLYVDFYWNSYGDCSQGIGRGQAWPLFTIVQTSEARNYNWTGRLANGNATACPAAELWTRKYDTVGWNANANYNWFFFDDFSRDGGGRYREGGAWYRPNPTLSGPFSWTDFIDITRSCYEPDVNNKMPGRAGNSSGNWWSCSARALVLSDSSWSALNPTTIGMNARFQIELQYTVYNNTSTRNNGWGICLRVWSSGDDLTKNNPPLAPGRWREYGGALDGPSTAENSSMTAKCTIPCILYPGEKITLHVENMSGRDVVITGSHISIQM